MSLLRHLPRFKKARQSLVDCASREAWSRGAIESFQLARINRIWAGARKRVPYYRELFDRLDLPQEFSTLHEFSNRVPVLEKSRVRETPLQFLSDHPAPGTWQRTGGSTGTPTRVFWETQSHLEGLQSKYRMLNQWQIDLFDRSVFFWGHHGSIPAGIAGVKQRIRRPIEDALRNRIRLSAYRLGPKDLDRNLVALKRSSAVSLYGYSTAISLLARRARETGFQIPSLRLAILTAEPAEASMLRQVATDLNCDAAMEYGSVECGVIAASFPDETLRVREDAVTLEAIENQAGSYDLIVTVLRNESFPLLRYRIGDVTSAPIQRPPSGFAELSDVMGRCNDTLTSGEGCLLHSMSVKHELEHFPAVRRFRAHQLASGELRVTIETLQPDRVPVDRIGNRLRELVKGYPVTINLTDCLEGNLAGKHRWVISDLA